MSEKIVYLSDDSFDSDVLQADVPVLVDYWAEWCGPCKMIGPALEELAVQYEGKIKIAKVNVDGSSPCARSILIPLPANDLRRHPSGSPPPRRAATVSSLIILVKILPRLASARPFLCLIVLHLL